MTRETDIIPPHAPANENDALAAMAGTPVFDEELLARQITESAPCTAAYLALLILAAWHQGFAVTRELLADLTADEIPTQRFGESFPIARTAAQLIAHSTNLKIPKPQKNTGENQ